MNDCGVAAAPGFGGRRHTFLIALVLAGASLVLLGAPTGHAEPAQPKTILVKFVPGVDGSSAVENNGDDPAAVTKTHVVVVDLKDGETVADGLADYRTSPEVAYAEPNVTYTAALDPPSDTLLSSQWALSRIQAFDAWTQYPGSYLSAVGSAVAVVDTGVDTTGADLSDGRVLSGASCLSGTCVSDSAADDNGHGTSVAGVLAGSANDSAGIAGEAFGSPVLPVKALDSAGSGTADSIAAGIIYAADNGARVVNLSLAGPFSQTICDAVSYATTAGALVVAAAGNEGWNLATYPAACPGAIGVGATDANDRTPFWSNYGYPNVFVSAPGVSILTTDRGGNYTTVDGTSIAAPYVSGLAALLFSQEPGRTVDAVKEILARTSEKVGSGTYGVDPYSTCDTCTWSGAYGYGRINAAAALYYPAPPPGNFFLSASPATVGQGKSTSLPVSVGSNSGYAGSVNLSVSGLPDGATATFASGSVSAPGSSQLTITAGSTTPAGDYTLTITGSDGTLVHSTTVTLSVVVPDFTISALQSTATVPRGQSASYAMYLGSVGGFTGTVTMSVTGLPTYATGSFTVSSLAVPGSTAVLVKTATTTPAGTYTLTIKATSGTTVHTATVTLNVVIPDFSVSSSQSTATIRQTQTATYPVSVNALNGFTGSIALSVTGYPSGASVSYSPSSVAAPGTSTLTVKTASTTPGGTYTVTIKGTSSTKVVRSTTVTLTVIAPDFAVSSSPSSATVLQGQSAVYPVTVDALNDFTGNIALTVTGYPSGATVTYAPSSVAAPGTSTLTVKTAATTAIGTYTLTLTGTSASRLVRTTKVTLVVNPVGDFDMTTSATTVTVKRGSFFSPYAYFKSLNGFYANVYFSNSTLPAGMTATWSKTYLLVYGTSTLSTTVKLAATTAAVPGTYTIDLIGTAGPIVHRVSLTVVVI
jgi:subtilisin family serine protease